MTKLIARYDVVATAIADRVVSQFLAAWSTDDEALRRRHLQATWSQRSRLADHWLELEGLEAIAAHIAQFRADHPGARFMIDAVDAHHCWVRLRWRLLGCNGAPLLAGESFAELGDDRKIARLASFFDPAECDADKRSIWREEAPKAPTVD